MWINRRIFMAAQRVAISFENTKMTSADIFFFELYQFVTRKLKTSKISINHTRILIFKETRYKHNCSLIVFYKLFFQNSYLADALFYSRTKRRFSCNNLIIKLRSCFAKCRIDKKNYLDHSFSHDIAQHALDCRILNKNLQKLRP